MKLEDQYGVILESGANDWQIFQQDRDGMAILSLTGRTVLKPDQKPGKVVVQVRLVREDGYEAVTAGLNWQAATTRPDGTWSATLRNVPRGGLYRLETCLQLDDGPIEWAWRHPECVAAREVATDGVELVFENIEGRLHYESRIGREFPFAVRDSQGEVPVTGYTLPGRDRFRIMLGRPLTGPATVTGAPTANPPACVPFDIPGYRSMLGFTLPITLQ